MPPHWHNRFAETFDLISGSMSVYSNKELDLDALEASVKKLEIGTKVTIEPGLYHKYKAGDEDTVLRAIVTPGDADFEKLLKILNGLAADGKLESLGNDMTKEKKLHYPYRSNLPFRGTSAK